MKLLINVLIFSFIYCSFCKEEEAGSGVNLLNKVDNLTTTATTFQNDTNYENGTSVTTELINNSTTSTTTISTTTTITSTTTAGETTTKTTTTTATTTTKKGKTIFNN
jgi:LytS/YehU family sensor histidine kinase